VADYTKTISNSLNLFGLNPSSKWGEANYPYTMVWGTTKWGEGSFAQVFSIEKFIDDSVTVDTTLIKEAQKLIENSISPTEDMYSEVLTDGDWSVVFPGNTVRVRVEFQRPGPMLPRPQHHSPAKLQDRQHGVN